MAEWRNANNTHLFHECQFAYVCGGCGSCPLYTICDGVRDTIPPTGYANSWGSEMLDPTPERTTACMLARRAGLNITLAYRLPTPDVLIEGFRRGLLPLPIVIKPAYRDRLPLSKYRNYRQWLEFARNGAYVYMK